MFFDNYMPIRQWRIIIALKQQWPMVVVWLFLITAMLPLSCQTAHQSNGEVTATDEGAYHEAYVIDESEGIALADSGVTDLSGEKHESMPDAEAKEEQRAEQIRDVREDPIAFPREWHSPMMPLPADANYPYARAIIHLHSVYSHDACDNKPMIDGKPNMPCLLELRKALCDNAIDAAFMTEHSGTMGDGDPIEKMVLHLTGDTYIISDGRKIGNLLKCEDGHRVAIYPGAENELMPIALHEHPQVLPGKSLRAMYNASTPEAIQRFKDAGAIVLVPHTENKTVEYIQKHDLHGVEIYNLHVLLDPRIRKERMDMPPESAIGEFYLYLSRPNEMPHPDLVFIGIHEPLTKMLNMWDQTLSQKLLYGYGGTDAHQNVLPKALKDGQRADGYARMIRWFSNHLHVKDKTWQAYREAIATGNSMLVFEILGTPADFEFYGLSQSGHKIAMGSHTREKISSLHVRAKHPYLQGEQPVYADIRLIQITAAGSKIVAQANDQLQFADPPTGTYRVEVWITPHHFKYLLTEYTEHYIRSMPWIYSNPIRID